MTAIQRAINFANSVKNVALSPRGKAVLGTAAAVTAVGITAISALFITMNVQARKRRKGFERF